MKEFFQTPLGRACGVVLLIVGVSLAVWSIIANFSASDGEKMSSDRTFVCAETLKGFKHTPAIGEKVPVYSPFSQRNTGYPAELCYWTKDGKIKEEPTAVLMNAVRKMDGPTYCPDCGRLVVPYNPKPNPGDKAPPTKSEQSGTASN